MSAPAGRGAVPEILTRERPDVQQGHASAEITQSQAIPREDTSREAVIPKG